MQYNNHFDDQDIVSAIGDATGISKTAEIKQITRAVNEANRQILTWIFEAYGGWQYDDSNQTDLPSATANLVADQITYQLPTTALTVRAVEFKNQNGDWEKLDSVPIDLINQHTSEKEWQDEPSTPRWYGLVGRTIKLYPASNVSVTGGLRLQFDRGTVTFVSTDISKTPGFATEFHDALVVGASYIIARNKSLKQVNELEMAWDGREKATGREGGYKKAIKNYYIKRWQEEFPPQIRVNDLVEESK